MALGTGSIRFSQIVSEFGGVSPHRFSEYYALNGLGVSGIPASGLMKFSQFRGKSNQVTTSVWVESGYNQTVWSYVGAVGNSQANFMRYSSYRLWIGTSYYGAPTVPYTVTTNYYTGIWNMKLGSHYYTTPNGDYRYYRVNYYKQVTSWVDTSSWQNTTTTAQIST